MILLKNGNLLTMEDNEMYVGDVLIDGDRIVKVGKNLSHQADQVIDLTGKYVMPGMIDAHCHIGLWEDGLNESEGDGNELTDPVTPQMRAIDAINPFDNCFKEAREAGVTVTVTGPGSGNVFGGQFVAVKTVGRSVDEMLVNDLVGVKAALGENPKRVYSEQQKTPSTRMAIAAILRETLYEAKDYLRKLEEKEEDDKPDKDLSLDVLCKVLKKEVPLKIHVHRAEDIQTALRIKKEFDIDITLDHCTEGHIIPEYIKGEKIILGPLLADRSKVELRQLNIKAPGILDKEGVEFCLATDHPVTPIQYLPVEAALCVREGLNPMVALRSITINPANVIGLGEEMGSLKAGKVANIAVFDGFPLDYMSKAELVFIDGVAVFEK